MGGGTRTRKHEREALVWRLDSQAGSAAPLGLDGREDADVAAVAVKPAGGEKIIID